MYQILICGTLICPRSIWQLDLNSFKVCYTTKPQWGDWGPFKVLDAGCGIGERVVKGARAQTIGLKSTYLKI